MSVFILLSIMAVTWSTGNIMVKKSFKNLTPWQIYAFDAVIIALPLWIIYGIWQGGNLLAVTPVAFGSAFLISLVYALYYLAIYKGPLGLTTPIIATYPVFTVILALVLLHEQPGLVNIIGIIITITGIVLISLPEKLKLRLEKWVLLSVLVSLGYGITGYTGKVAVSQVGNATYLMILAVTQVMAVLLWKPFTKDRFPVLNPQKMLLPFIGILLLNIGNITYYMALERGLASVVVPLSNSYIVLLIILSMVILKEKIRFPQLFGILMVILGVVLVNLQNNKPQPPKSEIHSTPALLSPAVPLREKVKVSYVFDGDTIELTDKRRIRYIGINTPELNTKLKLTPDCFATNAAEINKQLVQNQEIEMEKDQSEKDVYGRYLRYVWIDDVFINDFLVRQGFAKIENIPPDTKYAVDLKNAQTEAKKDKRGLWGKCQ